ncbi:MAG: DUF3048 domain-containing protein [bacterium]|nr:DUF3048 domain-containing protein [bacterium]
MRKFKLLPTRLKIILVVVFAAFVLVWTIVGFYVGRKAAQAADIKSPIGSLINKDIIPQVADFPNPINGMFFTKEEAKEWKDRLPLAVVIENHTDVRPQSGLNKADVVYETLAEGGITRFLAIFLASETSIGPVRSNRPYFLDWVSEYSAGYAHVGGSPEAQGLVKTYSIRDLDQFFIGAPTYERVSYKYAPHNVYTTTQKLRGAAATRGYKGPVTIKSWQFADEEMPLESRPKAFTLDLGFSGAYGYDVRWVYEPKTNTYQRFNGGAGHIDAATNTQLTAKTIIVEYAAVSPDPSGHSRIKINTIGSGKVIVFTNGNATAGTWKKASRPDRTAFFDNNGKEIPLNRGLIWIEVVPDDSPVSFK